MTRKILILTANSNDSTRLRTDHEMQEIQEKLKKTDQRNQFELIFRCARPNNLLHLIEDERPEIVHFCCHGDEGGLALESEDGNAAHIVSTEVLKMLFERNSGFVKCVLLNACHSEIHAKAISEHIPFVIGMRGTIWDKAAIAFAGAFYKDLGKGRPIEFAFKGGLIAALIVNPNELPKLFRKDSPNIVARAMGAFEYFILGAKAFFSNIPSDLRNLIWLVGFGIIGLLVILLLELLPPRIVSPPSSPPPTRNSSPLIVEQTLSSGQRTILERSEESDPIKIGIQSFIEAEKTGNYAAAIENFNQAIAKDPNNPEPYIYRNNALARKLSVEQRRKIDILAAVIPAKSNARNRAEEMLRGIADAQTCFNGETPQSCLPNSKKHLLEVKLADDRNDGSNGGVGEKIAEELSKPENNNIAGIIGHYASGVTSRVIPTYASASIPVISPTSTSSNLKSSVFFRTVSSSKQLSEKLINFIQTQGIKQVNVFLDNQDTYSDSLWQDFKGSHQGFKIKKALLYNDEETSRLMDEINANEKFAALLIPPSADTTNLTENQGFEAAAKLAEKFHHDKNNLLLGGNVLLRPETRFRDGAKYRGIVLVVPWFAGASRYTRDYADNASARWKGEVNWVTACSNDAVKAFMQALSSIESTTNSSLPPNLNLIDELNSVVLPANYTSGIPLKFRDREVAREPILVQLENVPNCSTQQDQCYRFKLIS